jgi:predicted nuclease with TOPRIM domain
MRMKLLYRQELTMALAKYYEDILERLLEENERLSAGLWPEKATEKDKLENFDRHLEISKKFLNELYEVLTSPEVKPIFDNLDVMDLLDQRELLHRKIENLSKEKERMDELNKDLNSECYQLQRKVDKLEIDNKNLRRLNKKKK